MCRGGGEGKCKGVAECEKTDDGRLSVDNKHLALHHSPTAHVRVGVGRKRRVKRGIIGFEHLAAEEPS